MEKIYCVYMHKNLINGKIYIGQSSNLKDRWSRNGERYKGCTHFYAAIQKYGWENFEHTILEENISEEDIGNREQYWIAYYQANQREKGYNLTEGGETGKLSEETKQKMSESRLKYLDLNPNIRKPVICLETGEIFTSAHEVEKQKGILHTQISACCCHYPSAYTAHGYHWIFQEELPVWTIELANEKIKEIESLRGGSEEQKQKAHIARVTAKGKKVLCKETQEIFLSAGEAGRQMNIDSSSISKVCRGKQKTAMGYHFKYIEEEYKNDINE